MEFKKITGLWDMGTGVMTFLLGLDQSFPLSIFFYMMGSFIMGFGLNKLYEITVVSKQSGVEK